MRALSSLTALPWAVIALIADIGPSAAGDGTAWHERPHVALRLGAAALEHGGERTAWAAVELRLDPGWKIYWRSPGEAGIPTTIDWSGSENVRTAETRWPRPERARIWNVDTIGYGGEVTFPAALQLVDPARPTRLRVRVAYGVCREICIRDEAVLTLQVAPASWVASAQAERIRAALATVPDRGNAAALRVRRVAVGAGKLHVEVQSAEPLAAPDLFVEGADAARFGIARATVAADRRQARFDVPVERLAQGTWPLVLTLVDGRRAFERRVTAPFP